jgi:DNA-binding transcriptional LysR family regulator
MDTIKCMETFVAVAANKSFTEGAKQLSISAKLASKYVQKLEAKLGAQLFYRTTRSVTLTDTGQAYFERCVPLLDQFDELEGMVQQRQSDLAGPIRITAPTGFGSKELVKVISAFQVLHPKVTIDLHLADHVVSIVEAGFDLAIRFGQLEDSTLIARKLLDMRFVVVAAPSYLLAHGTPTHPSELVAYNCLLQMTVKDPVHWNFRIDNEIHTYKVSGSFNANSPRAITHFALEGLGIARAPLYVVTPYLESGELQILFEQEETSGIALNVVYPPNRHLTARIRAFIDHLVAYCGE